MSRLLFRAPSWLALLVLSLAACSMPTTLSPAPGSSPAEPVSQAIVRPRSIVILPIDNQSATFGAERLIVSTLTRQLAERGYYVFSPALTLAYLQDNGIHSAAELMWVPPEKYHQILGAQSALYVSIKEWTLRYVVFDAVATVTMAFKLIDTATGAPLWQEEESHSVSLTEHRRGRHRRRSLSDAIIGAAFGMLNASLNNTHQELSVAKEVVRQGLRTLPKGPRHPSVLPPQSGMAIPQQEEAIRKLTNNEL